jgi:hypothetical protein
MTRTWTCIAGIATLSLLATACGGPAQPPPATGAPNFAQAPKWVHKGSGAYSDGATQAFYGVGIVQGVQNEALARQAADNRARAEIGKIFDLYVAAMMKDYQRSTTAGDMRSSAEEQDIVSAQKTITEVNLRGVEVRDHWVNPQSGALYALAVLDLDTMTRNLDQAKGLDARIRDHVRANARRAFNDLDRELSKRSERQQPAAAAPPPAEPEPQPAPAAAPPPAAAAAPAAAPARPPRTLRVGLRITGHKASIIQTCFASKLTEAGGFALFEGTSDVDVMVRGKLRYEKAGVIRGSQMVRADVELRLMDMRDGKTLIALQEKLKVGRPTLRQSVQTAITQLCSRVVPRMVNTMRARASR